ncbi:hypothetical protein GOY19_23460, partial [Aeromonas hydrophila]|nr:hypothetical protein [Aeromonas hydrophila]
PVGTTPPCTANPTSEHTRSRHVALPISARCRQLKVLEEHLGVSLFAKDGR